MESNYWKTTIDEANEYTSRKLSIRLDLFLYETKIRLLAFLKKKNKFMI